MIDLEMAEELYKKFSIITTIEQHGVVVHDLEEEEEDK